MLANQPPSLTYQLSKIYSFSVNCDIIEMIKIRLPDNVLEAALSDRAIEARHLWTQKYVDSLVKIARSRNNGRFLESWNTVLVYQLY